MDVNAKSSKENIARVCVCVYGFVGHTGISRRGRLFFFLTAEGVFGVFSALEIII